MRISYNWLKEYVGIKISAEKLAQTLTMAGLSVESVQAKGDDTVLEIEITSNRPDWLSVIGVAREVAALTGKKLKLPSLRGPKGRSNPDKRLLRSLSLARNDKKESAVVSVKVEDKTLCPRYTARVIRDVNILQSPGWLLKIIDTMGLRPVNNAVDITNYCLFETGEPMHAFDMDKIEGGVIVRRAKKGEKIITIDGVERTLDESMLVIADEKRPVAIAGVMGGAGTEVTSATKNILLEAAYFDPVSIRRTSRKLGLSTDSSYRFERRVDAAAIAYASDRASSLILASAGGTAGALIDVGNKAVAKKTIALRYDRMKKILGIEISPIETKKILSALGVIAKTSSKEKGVFTAPSFRNDLQDEIDLIEEVARIHGYGNIPTTVPAMTEQPQRRTQGGIARSKIVSLLASLGFNEIITYSLLSMRLVSTARAGQDTVLRIANPLTSEQEVMRPNLFIGMLNTLMWNINRKTKDLKLFELGNVYTHLPDGTPIEKMCLAIGVIGEDTCGWMEKSHPCGFFDVKGSIEALFEELGVTSYTFRHDAHEMLSAAACASIDAHGMPIGVIGEVRQDVARAFDIDTVVTVAQIDIDALMSHMQAQRRFETLPKHPSVLRDISIVAAKDVPHEKIMSLIQSTGGMLLKTVDLIDRYEGGQIPHGKASLTYRLEYQDPSKTLTEKEVQDVHTKVIAELDAKFDAKLR